MRAFLITLGLLAAIAVANPIFWSIMRMNFAAEPVVYLEHDGSTTSAFIGPQSPWPDWIVAPGDGRLTVGASFAPTAGPANGFGDFHLDAAPIERLPTLVADLEAAGWRVETSVLDTVYPSMPPRPMKLCTVAATRTSPSRQTIQYSFDTSPTAREMHAFWTLGAPPAPLAERAPGPCR